MLEMDRLAGGLRSDYLFVQLLLGSVCRFIFQGIKAELMAAGETGCKCTLGGILAEQNFEIHSILMFISSTFSTHISILISNPLAPQFY